MATEYQPEGKLMRALKPNLAAVAAKVIDGEAIIMNLTNGAYYSMAGVGGLIWSGIEAEKTDTEILEMVVAQYAVSADVARHDVDALISALLEDGLIVVEGAGTTGGNPATTGTGAYDTPALSKYTEMADLLALDPPMPALTDLPSGS
jgi:hypothetical protein